MAFGMTLGTGDLSRGAARHRRVVGDVVSLELLIDSVKLNTFMLCDDRMHFADSLQIIYRFDVDACFRAAVQDKVNIQPQTWFTVCGFAFFQL